MVLAQLAIRSRTSLMKKTLLMKPNWRTQASLFRIIRLLQKLPGKPGNHLLPDRKKMSQKDLGAGDKRRTSQRHRLRTGRHPPLLLYPRGCRQRWTLGDLNLSIVKLR